MPCAVEVDGAGESFRGVVVVVSGGGVLLCGQYICLSVCVKIYIHSRYGRDSFAPTTCLLVDVRLASRNWLDDVAIVTLHVCREPG